jgi:protoporphyrinogen IX oxidase
MGWGGGGAVVPATLAAIVSYHWLRALHIIFVVTWFAGLFYIFRLYVYHVENAGKREITDLLQVMERRLYRGICWPAMVLTTLFGVWLWSRSFSGYLQSGWFHVKLAALAGLFAYHFYSGKVRRDLAEGRCRLTSKQCRLINEVPTLVLITAVIMAVVKPF